MYIQTQQPKPRCSQCGSLQFHYWTEDMVTFIKDSGTSRKTWIECNRCGHKKIDQIITTSHSGSPISYYLPPQPEFKDF